jgi:hypothetical protein
MRAEAMSWPPESYRDLKSVHSLRMRAEAQVVAPKRQEKGKRISAPGDVKVFSDDDFAEMRSHLTVRRKGKKKANCARLSCRTLLERAGICPCLRRTPASS